MFSSTIRSALRIRTTQTATCFKKCQQTRFNHNTPHPLEIPPKVKGWPTPWLTKPQLRQYYLPLSHRGWSLSSSLSRSFPLPNLKTARNFIADVNTISDEEKHHPHETLHTNDPNCNTVLLKILTHSATPGEGIKGEGVTQRDIRLAVLIEELYAERYHFDAIGQEEEGTTDALRKYREQFERDVRDLSGQ